MINTLHVGKLDRHQNDKYITCGEIICKFKATNHQINFKIPIRKKSHVFLYNLIYSYQQHYLIFVVYLDPQHHISTQSSN